MTAATLHFSIPPERLDHDASVYLNPDMGPKWPLEAHDVVLQDLRPELDDAKASPQEQLEARGFALLKHKSDALGPLVEGDKWNAAYLEVRPCLRPACEFTTDQASSRKPKSQSNPHLPLDTLIALPSS
jgi:hypothetical protein